MDGTIANLYGVQDWLPKLIAGDETPYEEATVLLNMNTLAKVLNKLQRKGYEIGIITWLAKNGTEEYGKKVAKAKKKWLKKHLKTVQFNFIEIVNYGTDKNIVNTGKNDILFDDEEKNRVQWNGKAYDVNNILEILRGLN